MQIGSFGITTNNFPIASAQEAPEEFKIPGRVEGTGTHFEVTDSQYLNVTLDSSEPIHVILESIPEMITMFIESNSTASSSIITLSGFPPGTTFHKYEDDYHNHVPFITDVNGSYTWTQDISVKHFVFIQPRESTKFIQTNDANGHCASIGTFNFATQTCTLTTNVFETIQIDSNGITLDGNGRIVQGTGTGIGIFLSGKTGVTIKNVIVRLFGGGIGLISSSSNTFTSNSVFGNGDGIFLQSSSSNTFTSNSVVSNSGRGIILTFPSNGNTFTSNTIFNNREAIILSGSSSNTFTSNTIHGHVDGIILGSSSSNTFTSNTISSNQRDGIFLGDPSNGNTFTSNTIFNNGRYGIFLRSPSSGNTFTSNTISGSVIGIHLFISNNNVLTGNTANSNSNYGIFLIASSGNTLTGNTANTNGLFGIFLGGSSNNTLDSNTTNFNGNVGILLDGGANNNTVRDNIASSNGIASSFSSGISLTGFSNGNTLADNTVSNSAIGIQIDLSSSNTIRGNTVSNNNVGMSFTGQANNNQIYNNNFISNPTQAFVCSNCTGNIFNLAVPIGGNYWSNFDESGEGCTDLDADNFCDHFFFIAADPPLVRDELPWTRQNGWLNTPPVITLVGANPVDAECGFPYVDAGATAFDNEDGDLTGSIVVNNPVNTSILGMYTVMYDVTDSQGAAATTVMRTVNVEDTIPPMMEIEILSLSLVSVSPLVVNLGMVTASDICDSTPTITATRSDGLPLNDPFPIGMTTVTYTATDDTDNEAMAQQTVTILTPQQASQEVINDVQELVNDGALNDGQGNSLISKLENAIEKLNQGQNNVACNKLTAFINEVTDLINEGILTAEQGQPLIDAANEIIGAACV